MKQLIKQIEEYADDLIKTASQEDIDAFFKFICDDKKIHAIKILRKYKLIDV